MDFIKVKMSDLDTPFGVSFDIMKQAPGVYRCKFSSGILSMWRAISFGSGDPVYIQTDGRIGVLNYNENASYLFVPTHEKLDIGFRKS